MRLQIELDREKDGRYIADIASLPGVLAYGATEEEAKARVEALALRVLADQIERDIRFTSNLEFATACAKSGQLQSEQVLKALNRKSWVYAADLKPGSHRQLSHPDYPYQYT